MLALAASWLMRPSLDGNGLLASHNPSGAQRIERVALLTINDDGLYSNEPMSVRWEGYLYLAKPGEIYFRVPAEAQAKLTLGDDVVFDAFAGPPLSDRAVAYPAGGFNHITLEVAVTPTFRNYFEAGLQWQTAIGWQAVPAEHLYPQPIAEETAASAVGRMQWSWALGWLAAAFGAAGIAHWLWSRRALFASRTALGLLAIVILAFSLRLIFLRDYAAQPNADVLGYGSDNRGYQSKALDSLRGLWPGTDAFYMQPGMPLFLGAVYSLFGAHIRAAQLIQMILGACASAVIFDVARRVFDDATGWVAATLWAIFPLPIFYEAQLLTHSLEPIVGLALLWLWLRSLDPDPRPIPRVIAFGLALGAAAILRPTFLILAPFAALILFLRHRPRWREMIAWPALLAVATLIPILPITWHNYQSDGRFQLLTSNSDITLYLGNNRDSTGLGEYSPAYYATHTLVNQGKTTFFGQTLADVRNDPKRWAQLMIRKVALYLGDPERPNNVDFYTEGISISPLLAALPLHFGAMMALAIVGAALAVRKGHYYLLITYLISQIAVTVVYHVFSRFRAPIYSSLAILAAYPITFIISALRRKQWKGASLALTLSAVVGLFIAAMPALAESVMSRPIVRALPPTAKPLNIPIGESLTLVGHEPLPVVAPGDPFFITLYWQTDERVNIDYFDTVQLFSGDLKVTQADQAMGTGSFPDYPASQWKPGEIVRDTVFLQMPEDAPSPVALTLLVAAYDRGTGVRVGEIMFGVVPLTRIEPLTLPSDVIPVRAEFGISKLFLTAYAIRERALTLYWQADNASTEDAIIFVHLFDSNGNFAAGADSRPRNGLYPTLAWQAGEGIVDDHPLPDAPPGTYTIKIGMYDAATQNRLTVVNANGEAIPDGVLVLGAVTLP